MTTLEALECFVHHQVSHFLFQFLFWIKNRTLWSYKKFSDFQTVYINDWAFSWPHFVRRNTKNVDCGYYWVHSKYRFSTMGFLIKKLQVHRFFQVWDTWNEFTAAYYSTWVFYQPDIYFNETEFAGSENFYLLETIEFSLNRNLQTKKKPEIWKVHYGFSDLKTPFLRPYHTINLIFFFLSYTMYGKMLCLHYDVSFALTGSFWSNSSETIFLFLFNLWCLQNGISFYLFCHGSWFAFEKDETTRLYLERCSTEDLRFLRTLLFNEIKKIVSFTTSAILSASHGRFCR